MEFAVELQAIFITLHLVERRHRKDIIPLLPRLFILSLAVPVPEQTHLLIGMLLVQSFQIHRSISHICCHIDAFLNNFSIYNCILILLRFHKNA